MAQNELEKEFEMIVAEDHKKKSKIGLIVGISFSVFLIILIAIFFGFAYVNHKNQTIYDGVYIKGIAVSGLSKEEAIQKIEEEIKNKMPESILFKHGETNFAIGVKELEADFDVESAVDLAYKIGRDGNLFTNNYRIFRIHFEPINIEPNLKINKNTLVTLLKDMSTKLPDTVTQSSYYIEGTDLIITSGKEGPVIKVEELTNTVIEEIKNLTYADKTIEIPVETKAPDPIDIEKIHTEIYRAPENAYYTAEPRAVHPQVDGVDFKMTIEEAKAMVAEKKEEYTIPLKITIPEVTTNDIGMEAFPDLLGEFSTKYYASNKDRTHNLVLASNKINGTVIMPGETFSYNKIVGERTIAAGYREAAIYVDGKVEDGLGGGICQISSTLYNAVLYANLEIVSRSNHMFTTSYVKAGLDATVAYGSIDFKFKNNKNYPIKIVSSVNGGIANMKVYGLREGNEYEVILDTVTTGSIPYKTKYESRVGVKKGKVIQGGSNGLRTETYKTLVQNGQVISKTRISQDTYSAMDRIIAK